MKEKWNRWLPFLFLALVALSRWPGLFPENFSAIYSLAFCAGVYFRGATAWVLPLGTLLLTDIGLNVFYYHEPVLNWYMGVTLLAFAGTIGLGKLFSPQMNFFKLLGGGLLGAVLFYFVTNTASWLNNPAYAKTLAGWIQALTTGVPNFPPTWEFFRNTLLSGGLFTALFVGAMKWTTAESPAEKKAGARDEESETEAAPEEANA